MLQWYMEVLRVLRDIRDKAYDALGFLESDQAEAARAINGHLRQDYQRLRDLWNDQTGHEPPSYLGRHIGFGMDGDYKDILRRDIRETEEAAERLVREADISGKFGFEGLLHPLIKEACYQQYSDGHLRDAVLNSVIALFDQMRGMTGLDMDGENLANAAFSLREPYIVLSELETESGENDQKGFLQIFKGAFQGIRNPKAHSLEHDLTREKAAQYLVFASLLARRLDEATVMRRA